MPKNSNPKNISLKFLLISFIKSIDFGKVLAKSAEKRYLATLLVNCSWGPAQGPKVAKKMRPAGFEPALPAHKITKCADLMIIM